MDRGEPFGVDGHDERQRNREQQSIEAGLRLRPRTPPRGKGCSAWNGSGFANPVTNRFIYENWRVFAEVNSGGSPTHMWGLDLNGTLDDGGGVGGLLMVRDHSGGSYHFAAYDGNGNVAGLVNAADQATSARYEYSPFLEPIRASGANRQRELHLGIFNDSGCGNRLELLRGALLLRERRPLADPRSA